MILTKVFIPENHLKRESIHRFVYIHMNINVTKWTLNLVVMI